MKLPLLLSLALVSKCFAFADWQTTAVQTSSGITPPFQETHDSDATGDGKIHLTYVTRANDKDTLYYLSKDLYASPVAGIVTVPSPVEIDSGDSITSVQICHRNGINYFAYSKTNGSPFSSTRLNFATYRPGNPTPLMVESITSTGGPFQVSLEIHQTSGYPAVAFYSPMPTSIASSVSYAQKLNTSWEIELVEAGPDLGRNCDFTFGASGQTPTIVYEDGSNDRIQWASRNNFGNWNTFPVSGETTGVASQPRLFFTRDQSHLVYLHRATGTPKVDSLRLRTAGQVNAFETYTLDTYTAPVVDLVGKKMSDPDVIVSQGRYLITYNKPLNGTSTNPRVPHAINLRAGVVTQREVLPRASATLTQAGAPALSLDGHGYPIISWLYAGSSGISACYCPDFTDDDRDGIPYLHERAFLMNPNIPDRHKAPQPRIAILMGEPRLTLNFLTVSGGSIDSSSQALDAGLFRFTPQSSKDLYKWDGGFDLVNTRIVPSILVPPPIDDKIQVSLVSPVDSQRPSKQFLTIDVFRK